MSKLQFCFISCLITNTVFLNNSCLVLSKTGTEARSEPRINVFSLNYKQLYLEIHSTCTHITAPFNNMQTLKFKAQPTNAFFTTVNQIFGGPPSFQLCCVNCAQLFDLITMCLAVVESWEVLPNIRLMVAKNAFVG